MAVIPYVSKRLQSMGMSKAAADLYSDPTNATPTTKRVTMSLGAPRTTNGAGTLTDWTERIPIVLPVKTTRWRLRVGNRQLSNTPGILTTVFTVSDIVYGQMGVLTAQYRRKPQWSATPVKAASGGNTPADGTDWVSEWVTDPALQFGPSLPNASIGLGLSSTNNGNGSATTSSHYGYRNLAAGAANTLYAVSAAGYFGNTMALDKRLEYEFVGDNSVGLYVGPSGDEGYNLDAALDGAGGYEPVQAHETYPGVFGMMHKIPWVNTSIVGATQAPFLAANSLAYTRFDLTTTVPDFAIISMGGNSILTGGIATSTIQSETATVVATVRSFGVQKIYLSTVCAIGLTAGDAKEIQRQAVNAWIRTVPLNVTGIVDVDLFLRDPAVLQNQMTGFVAADAIHPKLSGYQRWGSSINLR